MVRAWLSGLEHRFLNREVLGYNPTNAVSNLGQVEVRLPHIAYVSLGASSIYIRKRMPVLRSQTEGTVFLQGYLLAPKSRSFQQDTRLQRNRDIFYHFKEAAIPEDLLLHNDILVDDMFDQFEGVRVQQVDVSSLRSHQQLLTVRRQTT